MVSYKIRKFKCVDSTNSRLRSLLNQGTEEGLVVLSALQTAGRGSFGRTWESAMGNLFFSIYVKPQCNIQALMQFTHIASLAVAMAVEPLLPPFQGPKIKWPNDVLVGGGKLSGILLESIEHEDESRGLIVGIGVNLRSHPDGVSYPATSLAEWCEGPVKRGSIFVRILRQFGSLYFSWRRVGFLEIRKQWLARSHDVGDILRIKQNDRVITGAFQTIDENGFLLLGGENDSVHRVGIGEILQ